MHSTTKYRLVVLAAAGEDLMAAGTPTAALGAFEAEPPQLARCCVLAGLYHRDAWPLLTCSRRDMLQHTWAAAIKSGPALHQGCKLLCMAQREARGCCRGRLCGRWQTMHTHAGGGGGGGGGVWSAIGRTTASDERCCPAARRSA